MAGRKEYELLLKLKAALGSNFNSTFQTAMNTTKQLQNSLQQVKKVQGDISAYDKTQKAVLTTKGKVEELEKKHGDYQKQLYQTVTREKELQKALKDSEKATGTETEEYKQLQKELKATQEEKSKLKNQIKDNTTATENAKNKIAEQEQKLSELNEELKKAGINTDNLAQENDKLKNAYDRVKKSQEDLARINQKLDKNAAAISATRSELTKTVGALTAGGAAFYAGAIKPAMEFESAFAGVKKTISGTPEQLAAIQTGIRKMSTQIPLGTTEISAIAEAAGQLGIKTESILGFTRVMADLGVTTNLAGDEAASTLAKFANITGMSQGNFDRLGSTIVALGNNLATTEADIAAMSLRLAGAGNQVGLSEAQILSFAGALSSVGIEAEAGGSAFSKVMNNMQLAVETGNDDLISFAKVAGVSAAEFKKAFQTDAAGAINLFIKGLGNSQAKGKSAIKVLDDMGIMEVRMRDALLRAAGASDKFTESLAIGTQAWEENKALQEEAQQRYKTTESAMQIMKNAFKDIGVSIGSIFLPKLAETMQRVSELAVKFSEFAQNNPQLIKTILGVVGGLSAVKVGSLAGKLGFLEMEKGVLTAVKGLLGFKTKAAESVAAATVGVGKPLKGLGSLFGGLFGKVLPVVAVISALSILFLKLSGEDISSFIEPLEDAFTQLKPVLKAALDQFKELGNQLLPLLIDTAKQLAPILGQIITAILPVVLQLIQSIVPLIVQLVQQLLPVILNIITAIAPLLAEIITAVLPIVVQLLQTLLPIITQLVTSVMPIIVDVLNMIMPLITELIQAVLPVLQSVLQALMPIIQVLADLFSGVLGVAIQAMMPIVESLTGILKGIIDFVTGVFSGDWSKAWEGIVSVFKGIWDTITSIVSGIGDFFSGIFSGIGDFFGGLFGGNKETSGEPDIPDVPQFESGSDYTPDTFIAGDVGGKGGELVTGARGRKVFTAIETQKIFANISRAKAITATAGNASKLRNMPTSGGGNQSFTIQYSPTIYVDGNKPGDLEEKLKKNNESLLQIFKEFLRQERENERRMTYA